MLASHGRYPYSPITGRRPGRWPNGTGLAVYVALGVEEYVYGEGLTEDILPGASKPDLANTSWRDYGNRVGGFRLLERFARAGVPPTVLLNTEVYDHAPALIDAARRAGAEFVAHGLTNSDTLAGRAPDDESAYIAAVARAIAAVEGAPPAGWSSPWLAQTPTTLDILAGQGFRYVLDLRMDDQPVHLVTSAGPLLSIPYALELNDSSTIIGRQASAADFADMIVDEFDALLEASADVPLVMSVVTHTFISGQPFRLKHIGRALDHIARHNDRIWLTRPMDIAEAVRAAPNLAA